MRYFIKKYGKWLIAGLFFLLFLFITYYVKTDQTVVFDNFVYEHVRKLLSQPMNVFFIFMTSLSSPLVLITVTILCILFLKPKGIGFFVFANLVIIGLSNLILKGVFMRERPSDFFLIEETGYSYPSGHSMTSMCFYGFLIYLVWKSTWKRGTKIILTILFSFIILMVGLSRIYLRVHYVSDVLAGFSISIVYLVFISSVVEKWRKKHGFI